ncbi:efflux transporter outer membrane subunit [Puniceibacterium sediminis]|uniref:Outer membrane protein, multidrug efflux system n=1 Tax=Puniceibacterium sediminis TaxID=1608407 RepID=A0A238WYG9_9RHOB|nr:efflux transporter outer membrane subunit [Puniceibacterium sediminis]SNR51468.1 outer membrane protein, multidrug efflux system [Puniceibacterium sediminis]
MNLRTPAMTIVTLGLAACTAVGPNYKAPDIALTASYVEGGAAPIGDVSQQLWWTDYQDKTLNALVDRGLAQNLDIRTAIERITEAQASLRTTGLSSQVGGSLSGSLKRSGSTGVDYTQSTSATFNPSIILDLFGGEQRTREQALAQLEAAQLDVGVARLAFLSALISNYIDARYYQEALAITRQNLSSRGETLDLVKRQRSAGTVSDLDVARAQAVYDETRANVPSLEANFLATVYALATLLAEPAQPLIASLQRGAPQPRARGNSGVGIPADLLRNRPDVRSSERDLAAAVAAIGVAEAQLFPALSLSGTVTSAATRSWNFGPAISIPVLNQPVLRGNRDQAISRARQAELAWRASVLGAVEDVQSAQTAYSRSAATVSATRAALTSYERVVELSRATYEGGTTTLLDLLDSERSRGSAQLSLAQSVRDQANDWGTLQIASGRGWNYQR